MLNRFLPAFAFAVITATALSFFDAATAELAPQTSDENEVKVTVTPPDFSSSPAVWNFEVSLETHTRTLDDDLSRSAQLIVDGKLYASPNWEGSPPGGHHRKGVLRFAAMPRHPHSIELRVRLAIDGQARRFQWTRK